MFIESYEYDETKKTRLLIIHDSFLSCCVHIIKGNQLSVGLLLQGIAFSQSRHGM